MLFKNLNIVVEKKIKQAGLKYANLNSSLLTSESHNPCLRCCLIFSNNIV